MLKSNPSKIREVLDEAKARTQDMNLDLARWSRQFVPFKDYEDLRERVSAMLCFILRLCEQPLKHYLGIAIAVAPQGEPYDETQDMTVGKILHKASVHVPWISNRINRINYLRNAAAHISNYTIDNGQIAIRSRKGKIERFIEQPVLPARRLTDQVDQKSEEQELLDRLTRTKVNGSSLADYVTLNALRCDPNFRDVPGS